MRAFFLLLAFALTAPLAAQKPGAKVPQAAAYRAYLGPIPVQWVAPGREHVLDLRRFYQPGKDGAGFEAKVDGRCALAFDEASCTLRVKPADDAKGVIDLPFHVRGDGGRKLAGVLTLAVQPRFERLFRYTPPAGAPEPTAVMLVGSFNGWNKESHPLQRDSSGWVLQVVLEPGTHTYKFLVDGAFQPDPSNPRLAADGFGGNNSVLEITAAAPAVPPVVARVEPRRKGRQAAALTAGPGSPAPSVGSLVQFAPDGTASVVAESSIRLTCLSPHYTNVEFELRGTQPSYRYVLDFENESTVQGFVGDGGVPGTRDRDFDYRDAVMYFPMTDRFANGSKANDAPSSDPNVLPPANWLGGDWAGIRQKIEEGYFQRLGVNVLWLGPLNLNPPNPYREYPEPNRWYTGYHGYWPISATEVETRYGTAADLKALIAAAHQRGLKVVADLVLHHVHELHPFWKEHRDWFGRLELPDGRKNLRLWDEHQFTTWFEPYLPSFDFDHPAATAAMIDNTIWWVNEFNLDGFRLDAVKHIPPTFWWKFRAALRDRVEAPGRRKLFLVGETFQDRAGIMQFVGPNMLDGQFDFPLYDAIIEAFAKETAGLDSLAQALAASERAYGPGNLMSPLIGNHDKGRFMAYADGDLPDPGIAKEEEVGWSKPPKVDKPESYAKLALAQAFLMSIDGVPMLYYGDEYGETGAGDPDNRRMMRFGEALSAAEKGALEKMQFYGQFRARHPALRRGTRRNLATEKDVLAFVRSYGQDKVVCLFHRGTSAATFELKANPELSDGEYRLLPKGEKVTVRSGRISVTLGPREAAFICNEGQPPGTTKKGGRKK